ncbi:MAG: hypothetical protein IJW57_06490 [Spirochaetaceae bacterium]|mgnify:CR=1 FL=1|nr:hypothetical protein [Spirochaetaceae bacterium]
MIGEFLSSCILVAANAYFCSIVSGGLGGELVQWIEMAGYIGILALFILLSGYEKSFCNIFAIPKRQKAATLQELKKNNSAISYAMKATVFIGLFFLLMGTSFFYINFWNTQTLGSNLGTVILSLLYLLFIEQVLIVLKSKNKTRMIKLMGGGDVCKVNQRKDSKSICISISKAIFSIVLILIIACIVIKNETKNETEFNFGLLASWIDLPSALELFILSFALLAISGNSSNFWSSIKIAFKNQKISVTQKNLYVNAIQTLSSLILVTGLACTLIGFMTMLVYLENRSMLGYNVQVALIASFYAVVSCLILLPLETKICSLAEGDS